MSDDFKFPSTREVRSKGIRYGASIIIVAFVLGLLLWVLSLAGCFITTPVNTAAGVATRIMDPDAALQNYRWFRDARNGIEAQKANIADAKENLAYAEQHAPDRVSSRMTELTGAKQVCNQVVGEYNSRSERVDSRLFKDPGQFFTGLVDDQRPTPLPQHFDYTECK